MEHLIQPEARKPIGGHKRLRTRIEDVAVVATIVISCILIALAAWLTLPR